MCSVNVYKPVQSASQNKVPVQHILPYIFNHSGISFTMHLSPNLYILGLLVQFSLAALPFGNLGPEGTVLFLNGFHFLSGNSSAEISANHYCTILSDDCETQLSYSFPPNPKISPRHLPSQTQSQSLTPTNHSPPMHSLHHIHHPRTPRRNRIHNLTHPLQDPLLRRAPTLALARLRSNLRLPNRATSPLRHRPIHNVQRARRNIWENSSYMALRCCE